MNGTIQTVPFHGLSLSAVLVNGAPFVAIRPVCEALGLDWSGQFRRIKRDPVLMSCVAIMTTQLPGDSQTRKAVFLPLDRLNGWLFGVDVARVREELRERLGWYRRECFAVLARHFGLSRPGADLHARLIAAEQAEAQSFAVASLASRATNQRRREKPKLHEEIQTLRESAQLALPLALEGGAA